MSELEDLRVEVELLRARLGLASRTLAAERGDHERVVKGLQDCWKVDMKDAREARAKVAEYERILSNLDCDGEGYECLTHQSKWVSWDSPVGECEWARDHSEVPAT